MKSSFSSLLLLMAVFCSAHGEKEKEKIFNGKEELHGYSKSCEADSDCPPWTECDNTECMCRENLENLTAIKCDKATLQLSVTRCNCVTYDNETEVMFQGNCIENCDNGYEKSEYLPLPLDATKLNQFMCEERWNRTGRLCGSCLPGHSPLAYSYDMRCVKCPEGNRNFWKYILAAFGPSTIFFFIVIVLKIKVTSLHLHGYFLFCQVVSAPPLAFSAFQFLRNHENTQLISMETIGTMYSMWNLDFFRGLYSNICLDVSTLTVLALDYADALYPLLLIVATYILIEIHARNVKIVVILWKPFQFLCRPFLRSFNSRTTVIDAFATFFLISFTKLGYISAILLIPIRAHNLNNDSFKWVLYFDATLEYFGSKHLPYAILAIVCCSVFTIFPIVLLIVYQCRWFQRMLSCLKLQHQLLQDVMESFQSCYKNGTEPGTRDHRWFAAMPLITCFSLLLLYAFILESNFIPFGISIIVSTMIVTVLVQPYKEINYFKTDLAFWGLLTLFFSIDESTMYGPLKQPTQLITSQWLQIITIVIPLLYIICVSVYWILSRMRKVKTLISRIKAWRRGYENMQDYHEDNLPDRLNHPEHYLNLQDTTTVNASLQTTNKNDTY